MVVHRDNTRAENPVKFLEFFFFFFKPNDQNKKAPRVIRKIQVPKNPRVGYRRGGTIGACGRQQQQQQQHAL